MNINLIRLINASEERVKAIKEEDNEIIDSLNANLFDDDYVLGEEVEDSLFTLYFVESGGCEQLILPFLQNCKDSTIFLLSTNKNNSLAACFEIKSYVINVLKKQCYILCGSEDSNIFIIKLFAKTYFTKASLSEDRLGVIGSPSDWLINTKHNTNKEYEDFYGVKLIDITLEELYEEIDKQYLAKRIPHYNELKKLAKDETLLNNALYVYSALKTIIKKYKLNGLTIRCFDLIKKYKTTACLALSLLNEEGISCACEGDIDSLITMRIISLLSNRTCFQANPSLIDFEQKSIILSHCTLPFNMMSSYTLPTHFESNCSIAIKGEMLTKEVSVVKAFLSQGKVTDTSLSINGTIKENLSNSSFCRTQINVSIDNDQIIDLMNNHSGNHLLVCYGDIRREFISFMSFLEEEYHFKKGQCDE